MLKVDEYHQKAKNCERLAQKAKFEEAKRALEDAALRWRQLAALAEQNEPA